MSLLCHFTLPVCVCQVRQLQVRQERERCRVLEQSLHVLATEHHQLELTLQHSLSMETPSAADRLLDCTLTSEDEFFDADDGTARDVPAGLSELMSRCSV